MLFFVGMRVFCTPGRATAICSSLPPPRGRRGAKCPRLLSPPFLPRNSNSTFTFHGVLPSFCLQDLLSKVCNRAFPGNGAAGRAAGGEERVWLRKHYRPSQKRSHFLQGL